MQVPASADFADAHRASDPGFELSSARRLPWLALVAALLGASPAWADDYVWNFDAHEALWNTTYEHWSGAGTTWVNGEENDALFPPHVSPLELGIDGAIVAGVVEFQSPGIRFLSGPTTGEFHGDSLSVQRLRGATALQISDIVLTVVEELTSTALSFHGQSVFNANGPNLLLAGDGTPPLVVSFYDDSVVNANASGAIGTSAERYLEFHDRSVLNAEAADVFAPTDGSLSVFAGESALHANVPHAVTAGETAFAGHAALHANASEALAGGVHSLAGEATAYANATHAVSGGFISLYESAVLVVQAADGVGGLVQHLFCKSDAISRRG